MRISYGSKLKRDVTRTTGMCLHTFTYELVNVKGEPVEGWTFTVEGHHSHERECLFTDSALMSRLVKQLEMAGIELYRQTESDEKVVSQIAAGKVRTLDDVVKGQ